MGKGSLSVCMLVAVLMGRFSLHVRIMGEGFAKPACTCFYFFFSTSSGNQLAHQFHSLGQGSVHSGLAS